jgi:hypothetical protein
MGTAIMALGEREPKEDSSRCGGKRRVAKATARTGC